MINKKQLALSLFIGAGLILIKLVTLAFASPNDMQLQTVSSLFSMGMWYVPLLFVLLYYFVYSSICYLVLRVITYTLNNVLHKWSEAWNKLNAEQRRSICDWIRPAFLILITFLSNAALRIACSINAQDWLTVKCRFWRFARKKPDSSYGQNVNFWNLHVMPVFDSFCHSHHNREIVSHTQKPRSDLQLISNHPGF